jgi:hypothetical protein
LYDGLDQRFFPEQLIALENGEAQKLGFATNASQIGSAVSGIG